ncbi:outer membrane efflux protein [Desulfosarcina widdelii]|uniref:Outer membrane efflux protein n=1 Tax=Desulfosarcina widdelii TaxID=947919 RepID=A0A5K7Z3M0_9BACT|nr:efflux transporter outer membrane subunit [Desulfosarcina widdelii]BBO73074.1 outer membrane efflux protein [Desulfosarcina widdelii]
MSYLVNIVLFPVLLFVSLGGCALGPDYTRPDVEAPDSWGAWHSGDDALHAEIDSGPLQTEWWKDYHDPVLDDLVARALCASPDIETAALRFVQARIQTQVTSSRQLPELKATGSATYNRLSEHGTSTRLYDEIGDNIGFDKDIVVDILSDPFAWYQAGLDFSWEIDFWGHVARNVEAAEAGAAEQAAMLDVARLSVISDLVNAYWSLRSVQRQIQLSREDIQVVEERLAIQKAQASGGLINHSEIADQKAGLAAIQAGLPALQAGESRYMNRILLLVGEHPGALQNLLKTRIRVSDKVQEDNLPELNMGLPSTVALRRPDVRAAEARLHQATAKIGVARAELYPGITLGASLGLDSYQEKDFVDWGSRVWSIGPSLSLPLFNHGRLKNTVLLREKAQQEAAIAFHQTVLSAWHEIDDGLSRYEAARQTFIKQQKRMNNAREAHTLLNARFQGGNGSYLSVLDGRRNVLRAERDLAECRESLCTAFAAVNVAIGNVP